MSSKYEMELCLGSSCFSRGNKETVHIIKEWLKRNHLADKVAFRGARCYGRCSNGPNLTINDRTYEGVSKSMVERILENELGSLK